MKPNQTGLDAPLLTVNCRKCGAKIGQTCYVVDKQGRVMTWMKNPSAHAARAETYRRKTAASDETNMDKWWDTLTPQQKLAVMSPQGSKHLPSLAPAGLAPSNGTVNSDAAAAGVRQISGSQRLTIVDFAKKRGDVGFTDNELEESKGWLHQAASARRRGLVLDGWLRWSGLKRRNPSGYMADVWVLTDAAKAEMGL